MSFKNNRVESLPNKFGVTFKVGDGVNSGFNGDYYPYTVRKVSDSGKQVLVSKDNYKINQAEKETIAKFGQHEGSIGCIFIPQDVPDDQLITFKLNKWGGVFRW